MDAFTPEMVTLVVAMLAAGAVAGIAAGLFGIGGGFIVVPALIAVFGLLDFDPSLTVHMAIGTSLATIILTSLRSVHAHAKRGAVDFTVLRSWAPWIIVGVIAGLIFAAQVKGATLVTVFGIGVFLLSIHFLFPRLLGKLQISDHMPSGVALIGLAVILGGFSALLGIGGGTIAVLTMTLCGRPIHQAIATAAGFGAIIAIPGAIGFIIMGWNDAALPPGSLGYVNLIGLVAIASTSTLTAPIGAALAHRLPPITLKRVFGAYLVFTSLLMLKDVAPWSHPAPDDVPRIAKSDPNTPATRLTAVPASSTERSVP
ncbi:sulfite exporter TauE/SafE family protein [Parvularcula sp. LCG005]|uniref:sulfite exporter TauE/SafE family protein n=1 Tax=Parvularcula sp. LCG005 TaxID=3078805 RepID=UPI002941EF74|nr:sulfite exporter TauE/SafE family protein [Parvularcula sp. LCG005]WOI53330.1 sulfite exporter TauE/SafE family protein [Parvularcula sp. LCG005]